MELEAKYRLLKTIKAKTIENCDLAPYSLSTMQVHELRDVILDTADRTLSSQKYALRVRHDGKTTYLTLKTPGDVTGAVHARPEIETEISKDAQTDRSQWIPEIAQPVNDLIGDAELAELLTIRNQRRVWAILHNDQQVAELALDKGVITANKRTLPFHELEIELKVAGEERDLLAITTLLTNQLPLEPETKSKMQRGVELLNHTEDVDELKAMTERTPMIATAPLAEAGRAVLAKHTGKLYDAWMVAYRGKDPEGVHQMRVATRRLRAILALLGESVYDPKIVRTLRRRLREWASDLGIVRDADVFLEVFDEYAQSLEKTQRDQLEPLREAIVKEREQGREVLIDLLDSRKTAKFADQLNQFVLTAGAGVKITGDDEGRIPPTLVRDWVGSLVWRYYELLRAYEGKFEGAPIATLHRFRIEIKHLRYVLELFRDALAPETDSLLEILVSAQDHFGMLNDADVAIERVDAVLADHPANQALQDYRIYQVNRREELQTNAVKVGRTIWDLTFRRRLGAILSKV